MKRLSYEKKKSFAGFLFVAPWLLGFLYFFLTPFFFSFVYAVNDTKIGSGGMEYGFIGLSQFRYAFTEDTKFLPWLTSSLVSTLYQVPLILIFSMFIGVILNSEFKGRTLVRGIFFLPVIIAGSVIINILKGNVASAAMMSGSKGSVLFQSLSFNELLLAMNIPPGIINFLMGIINGVFELIWKSGVQILLFLAGLQSIPKSVYEAVDIEGATSWEKFWKITVPMVSPITIMCTFYTLVDTCMDYSNPTIRYIKDLSKLMKLTYSSVISLIYTTVIMAAVGLVFAFTRRSVHYMEE